jgi:hypothetical protein
MLKCEREMILELVKNNYSKRGEIKKLKFLEDGEIKIEVSKVIKGYLKNGNYYYIGGRLYNSESFKK